MTPEQKKLARHALGLPNTARRSYRNYYVVGPGGAAFEDWEKMVVSSEAQRSTTWKSPTYGTFCFFLTEVGACQALEPREYLDREDFPNVLDKHPPR